jgi:uncharacterized protein (TIRG00374 family)
VGSKRRTIKRLLVNFLRIGVTVAAVAYVLSQITWKDRLLPTADRPEIWGFMGRNDAGQKVLFGDDRKVYPLTPIVIEKEFIPGFITLLKRLDLSTFALVEITFPLSYFLLAKRWQWLLRTHNLDPGFIETLRLTWIGILMNHIAPSSTGGDIAKGWCIYRRTPGKRVAAVVTVLIDRALGLVSLMLIGALAMLWERQRPELAGVSRFAATVLAAVLIGGFLVFSGRLRRLLRVEQILARLPMSEHVQRLDASVFHFRNHLLVLSNCVAVSIVIHVWTFVSVYFLGEALNVHVSLANYFVFLPVVFTSGAFVPSIAGLGVLEGLFQHFFSMPGVGATPSSAVALCVLYRIVQLIAALPGVLPTYREFSAHGVKIVSAASEEDSSPELAASSSNLPAGR